MSVIEPGLSRPASITPVLPSLAHEKYVLISAGSGERELFNMM